MIVHLINNCTWLLYHKMIPLCIVYDITCHRGGFHSCAWALYLNLYTALTGVTVFTIFAVFFINRSSRWVLLTSSSTAFHCLDEFSNFSQILQFSQFSQFSQKSQFSSGPSQPLLLQVFSDLPNFPIFRRFYNICNFCSFRKNRSSCRGPLHLLSYLFSLNRRIFQFFANFAIFEAARKPGHISSLST